jgi:hypothetical protein
MAYIGVSPSNGVRQKHTYTATSGQTTFTGSDNAENVTLSYRDSNYVDVYRNGVKLGDADYTATSGTSVVLGEGAAVNDIVEIVTYDVFSVADTVSKADGGTFDGNVAMAGTLAVTGETTLSTHLNMGDNDIIKVGDGADLQIYHDPSAPGGATNFIKENGGIYTFIQGNTLRLRNRDGSKNYINMVSGAGVDIYYDNAPKLATTSTGIQVTGNIANASGDFTLDVAGDITLDADGEDIRLKDGGYEWGRFTHTGHFGIQNPVSNADIQFFGNDGGATITALTLDMSDAGTATFNHDIKLSDNAIIDCGGNLRLDAENANIIFQDTGTAYGKIFKSSDDFVIKSEINHGDIIFQGFYNGSTITALTLNMGIDGTAQFKDKIQCNSINTGSSTGSLTMFGGGTNKGGTIELSGGNNTGSTGAGIVFKTGASTSSPSEKMRIDQYGHVTMPNQPAFQVYGNTNTSISSLATYTTAILNVEVFDQNGDFNTGNYKFTAPVTGKYQLNAIVRLDDLQNDSTFYIAQIGTSNKEYKVILDTDVFSADLQYHTFTISVLADMDASDTAEVQVYQNSGTLGSSVVIGNPNYTIFSGYLVA